MKKPIITIWYCFFLIVLTAQQKKPFINSGEIIRKGVELQDAGKYKEALQQYEQVSRNNSNYILALYEIALTCQADSQFAKGIKASETAFEYIDIDPNREPELLTQYGSLVDDNGNPENALRVYDSALKKYPAYSPLYYNKGATLVRLKKYKEAEVVFKN